MASLDKEPAQAGPPAPKHLPPEDKDLDIQVAELDEEGDEEEGVREADTPPSVSGPTSGGEDFEKAVQAWNAGDQAEAIKLAFGADVEDLKVTNEDWVNHRRAVKAFKDKKGKILERVGKVEEVYGPIHDAFTRVSQGEYTALADALEKHTGLSWEVLNMRIAKQAGAKDPASAAKDKVIADLRAKLAGSSPVTKALAETLPKAHPVRGLDDWETRVQTVLEETSDEDGDFTMSPKAAADFVFEQEKKEFEKKQAVFSKKLTKATPRGRATGGATKRKMTLEDLVSDLGDE